MIQTCGRMVEGGAASFPCPLPPHPAEEPCYASEVPSSVLRRQRWVAERALASAAPVVALRPVASPAPTASEQILAILIREMTVSQIKGLVDAVTVDLAAALAGESARPIGRMTRELAIQAVTTIFREMGGSR